jgi:membrane protease YdiL (CAAX protease family)
VQATEQQTGCFGPRRAGNCEQVISRLRSKLLPERGPEACAAVEKRSPLADTIVVVMALVLINVAEHLLPLRSIWLSVLAAGALLAYARRCGLTWEQLGLSSKRVRSGAIWATGVVLAVAATYLVGVLLPATRPAFLDPRYHAGPAEALLTAFLLIPLRTILLEEVAFRSVLWGMLRRHHTTSRVLVISSSLFGLWHVLPALSFASARGLDHGGSHLGGATNLLVVLGTVGFTALGGVVAGELRRRSGSVLASAGMHWATNSLGVLFALAAWRMAA